MSGQYPPRPGSGPGAGGVGQRIEEAVELIEMELRHAIAYVNDAVIPEVRRESISAMRMAADTLRNLADRFEQRVNQGGRQPGNQQPYDYPPRSEPSARDNSDQDNATRNDSSQSSPPKNDPTEPRS